MKFFATLSSLFCLCVLSSQSAQASTQFESQNHQASYQNSISSDSQPEVSQWSPVLETTTEINFLPPTKMAQTGKTFRISATKRFYIRSGLSPPLIFV